MCTLWPFFLKDGASFRFTYEPEILVKVHSVDPTRELMDMRFVVPSTTIFQLRRWIDWAPNLPWDVKPGLEALELWVKGGEVMKDEGVLGDYLGVGDREITVVAMNVDDPGLGVGRRGGGGGAKETKGCEHGRPRFACWDCPSVPKPVLGDDDAAVEALTLVDEVMEKHDENGSDTPAQDVQDDLAGASGKAVMTDIFDNSTDRKRSGDVEGSSALDTAKCKHDRVAHSCFVCPIIRAQAVGCKPIQLDGFPKPKTTTPSDLSNIGHCAHGHLPEVCLHWNCRTAQRQADPVAKADKAIKPASADSPPNGQLSGPFDEIIRLDKAYVSRKFELGDQDDCKSVHSSTSGGNSGTPDSSSYNAIYYEGPARSKKGKEVIRDASPPRDPWGVDCLKNHHPYDKRAVSNNNQSLTSLGLSLYKEEPNPASIAKMPNPVVPDTERTIATKAPSSKGKMTDKPESANPLGSAVDHPGTHGKSDSSTTEVAARPKEAVSAYVPPSRASGGYPRPSYEECLATQQAARAAHQERVAGAQGGFVAMSNPASRQDWVGLSPYAHTGAAVPLKAYHSDGKQEPKVNILVSKRTKIAAPIESSSSDQELEPNDENLGL